MGRRLLNYGEMRKGMDSDKSQEPRREVVPPQHDDATPQQKNGEPGPALSPAHGVEHQQSANQETDTTRYGWTWKGAVELLMLVGILGTLVATCQQNEVMRVTLREDQRAWVGAVRVRESEIREGVPIQLGVVVKGGGRTPATNVRIRTTWSIVREGEGFCAWYKDNPVEKRSSRAVIFPDMEVNFTTVAGVLPQGTLAQMTAGTVVLYYYGMIDYDDVFTPPTAHCTTFCYVYTTDMKTPQICDFYNQVTDAKCDEGLGKCPAPPALRLEYTP